MHTFIKALALAAVGLTLAGPAFGQSAICGARDDLTRFLGEQYGEQQRGLGIGGAGWVVELWRNEAQGTWTLLRTDRSGNACAIADGTYWQDVPARAEAEGDSL